MYETWISPEKGRIHSCTIITTDANDLIRPIHDRMPVIIPKDKEAVSLDLRNGTPEALASLLKSYPADDMVLSEVDASMFPRPGAGIDRRVLERCIILNEL